jgi:hypothetical protein
VKTVAACEKIRIVAAHRHQLVSMSAHPVRWMIDAGAVRISPLPEERRNRFLAFRDSISMRQMPPAAAAQ